MMNSFFWNKVIRSVGIAALAVLPLWDLCAQIAISTFGTALTEDMNTLALTGTSSVTPPGWAFAESGTNANGTYTAGTGSSNVGDTYSFGVLNNTERAFGGLQSGSLVPIIGASYSNSTGGTIGTLEITYTGEQWRLGALGRVDRLDFQYSLDATSLTTGTWVNVNTLDFTAPVTTGTVGALNGNNSPNFTVVSDIITVSIPAAAVFWIRWTDLNATGSDDGLSVDNFSLTACPAVSCPADDATCVNQPPFALTGGTPSGGVYSGTGVSGGNFDPAAAGVGIHTITYTVTEGTCSIACDFTIEVVSSLVVDAGAYGPLCMLDPPITLMGTPAGGTWNGIGVINGNQFNPIAGTQTLTYTVNAGSGCVGSDNVTITVNACLMPPEMRWVLLDNMGEVNGSCVSETNCDNGVICFGLQYTPNATGILTGYTTGFFVSCLNGGDPVVSHASCLMTTMDGVQNACPTLDVLLWNFSANTGNDPVTQGVPVIVHQVCFTIPPTGTITIEEDVLTNLTTSIDVPGGDPVSEQPSYQTFSFNGSPYCEILPVRWLAFNAVRESEYTSRLDWVTADEVNNSHFEIQRSNDQGHTFESIGKVDAAIDPQQINRYQFLDPGARPGVNYYRLKQVDIDGRFGYSPLRSVMFTTDQFSVKVWPSPVREVLNIYISHAEGGGAFQLFDFSGRLVYEGVVEPGDTSYELDVQKCIPGMYSLMVTSGRDVHVEKVVVVK